MCDYRRSTKSIRAKQYAPRICPGHASLFKASFFSPRFFFFLLLTFVLRCLQLNVAVLKRGHEVQLVCCEPVCILKPCFSPRSVRKAILWIDARLHSLSQRLKLIRSTSREVISSRTYVHEPHKSPKMGHDHEFFVFAYEYGLMR